MQKLDLIDQSYRFIQQTFLKKYLGFLEAAANLFNEAIQLLTLYEIFN